MNKKLLATIVIILVLAIPIGFILLKMAIINPSSENNFAAPTTIPVSPSSPTLSIVTVSPQNNATNVPLNTQITITTNQSLSENIPVAILPTTQYTTKIQGNSFIISPQQLNPGTKYILTFRLSQSTQNAKLYSTVFTTTGPSVTPAPTDSYNPHENDSVNLTAHPDVYLANQLPYSTKTFSANYGYTTGPTGSIYFTVQLKGDSTTAKQDFLNWLHSLQLTDAQISQLVITYQ